MATNHRVISAHPSDCLHHRVKQLYSVVLWCTSCGAVQDGQTGSGWFLPHCEELPMMYAGRMFEACVTDAPKTKHMAKLETKVGMLVSDMARWRDVMVDLQKQVCRHVTPEDATNAAASAAAAALDDVDNLRQKLLAAEFAADKHEKQMKAVHKRLQILERQNSDTKVSNETLG
ncbi:MAG: hypothetical protein EOO38_06435 [Cytophagaceae bacterium]|nr:MAG: hypothetical protein EOO38_06435 [Cytophagaceae bacterium]